MGELNDTSLSRSAMNNLDYQTLSLDSVSIPAFVSPSVSPTFFPDELLIGLVAALTGDSVQQATEAEATPSVAVATDHGVLFGVLRRDGAELHPFARVQVNELLEALGLPGEYRWAMDELGPFITGPGLPDYHPTAEEVAWLGQASVARVGRFIKKRVVEKARAEQAQIPEYTEEDLASRADVSVTLDQAREAGYCEAGVRRFSAMAGIDASGEATVAEIMAKGNGDPRVHRIAAAAVARADGLL